MLTDCLYCDFIKCHQKQLSLLTHELVEIEFVYYLMFFVSERRRKLRKKPKFALVFSSRWEIFPDITWMFFVVLVHLVYFFLDVILKLYQFVLLSIKLIE